MIDVKNGRKVELQKTIVYIRNDDILVLEIKQKQVLYIDDAKDIVKAVGKIGNEQQFPVLILPQKFADVDTETRAFAADPKNCSYAIANAIVARSIAHKIIANFYLQFNKPAIPTKVFKSKSDAIEWLKKFNSK